MARIEAGMIKYSVPITLLRFTLLIAPSASPRLYCIISGDSDDLAERTSRLLSWPERDALRFRALLRGDTCRLASLPELG